jgi:nitrate reductase NapE component
MNYRDLKKLIPPSKDKDSDWTQSGWWIIAKLLLAMVGGFGFTIWFFVWIAGGW